MARKNCKKNLILSHACGVGDYINEEIVRIATLLRAKSLALGHSGVRPEVVETIIQYLNHGVIPVIPRLGSFQQAATCSLSHIALGLIGEGKAHYKGKVVPIKDARRKERIKPLILEAKEGLALGNNGVQYSNAIAIFRRRSSRILLQSACLATAMSAQVMLGAERSIPE